MVCTFMASAASCKPPLGEGAQSGALGPAPEPSPEPAPGPAGIALLSWTSDMLGYFKVSMGRAWMVWADWRAYSTVRSSRRF